MIIVVLLIDSASADREAGSCCIKVSTANPIRPVFTEIWFCVSGNNSDIEGRIIFEVKIILAGLTNTEHYEYPPVWDYNAFEEKLLQFLPVPMLRITHRHQRSMLQYILEGRILSRMANGGHLILYDDVGGPGLTTEEVAVQIGRAHV